MGILLAELPVGGLVAGVVIGILFLIFVFIIIWASRLVKVAPNEALIISGSRVRHTNPKTGQVVERGFRIVKGGRAFVWPVLQKADLISLEIMTIDYKTPEVYTINGIPVVVSGVAQIKIRGEDTAIATAAEQFLSKSRQEMERVSLETLEGHVRSILGTLTVEQIYRDRESFAQKVQEVSSTDFANMGLEVVSLTIKEVSDTQGYLDALGKPRLAEVKRDAIIAQAKRDQEATIESAKATQAAQQAKFDAETRIAESKRDFEMRQAEYQANVNQKKADADLAYDLEKYKIEQAVKAESVKVIAVEKERMIEVQEKETLRKEQELQATVQKPAEAEQKRIMMMADANRYQVEAEANARALAAKNVGIAEAEAQRAKGMAEAEVIKAKGMAEAEAMMRKADAWRAYNEAAVAQMFIEKLPDLARAVAEPLQKIEKIVLIGNGSDGSGMSKISKEVIDIISQLPPVLEGVAGVKLQDLISRLPKLSKGSEPGKKQA